MDERPLKPSEWLDAVLNGHIGMKDAPPAIQSWARHPIYLKSCQILRMPKRERRAEIDRAPEAIRPHIEAEVIRVHRMNRGS